ncbi:alpha/beta hydrolase family protein [Anaeromyxobacter oryzae]|uniref:Alpha/beta hydrolase n=1 Tax=Anaeromyxobacter oryzae TaxID=2918170 RepID=A0ABM7WPX2_9BACT|nr:hypothetical protein [Anaeromyxobacter oryzae]BDG01508.1 hypothetical protein AMOR_05040 [Anaeromyxobacter oryzae]
MRSAARIVSVVAIAVLLVVTLVVVRLRLEDPFATLPRAPPAALVAEREAWAERWRDRTLVHVTLDGGAVGPVRFVVSLPEPLPETPLPVVVVLGGLRGGSNAIRELGEVAGDAGPNAIVGFDWPFPDREPGLLEIVLESPAWRRNALSVPGQVDVLLRWAADRPWADRGRVSLLGFSLGGFVVPAAQWLVERRGENIGWTVIAYAGAPIGDVIARHPKVKPRWLAGALGAASDLLLRPVEPSFYLPELHGRFLLLGGRTDRLIALAAAERMRRLTPQPNTVRFMEGDHMGVGAGKQALLREVIASTRAWLLQEGAIEPPRARADGPAPQPGRSPSLR